MESTILHIEYLIQRHDCVILPGIGAFIASRGAARYVEKENRFLPPARHICFNSAISTDDGLLIDSIRRRGGMSFEKARGIMSRDIDSIKQALERDGEFTIGKIGVLSCDKEKNISYRPFRSPEEIMADMGLTAVEITTLEENVHDKETGKRNELLKSEISALPSAVNNTEPTSEFSRGGVLIRKPGYYYIPINKGLAKIAAILLLTIIVSISLLIPHTETQQKKIEASVIPVTKLQKEIANREDSPINEERGDTDTNEGAFHLIVASFNSYYEAETFIEAHKASSYGLQIEQTGRMWLISAACSDDKITLIDLSRDEDFKKEFNQSWVWKNKTIK